MEQDGSRVRSFLVSHISIPEGIALLQQRGVLGSHEELSLVWQRCAGDALALVMFGALANLGGISLSYLLHAPNYQELWSGEVTENLIGAIYQSLNPAQNALVRALCLFHEPAPLQGVLMAAWGDIPSPKLELELGVMVRNAVVQQIVNTAGVLCFVLHPLVRHYVEGHYIEGSAPLGPYEHSSTSGLRPPLNLATGDGSPALQNALATGHMQVALYYQHVIRTQCPPRGQRSSLRDIEPIIAAIRHLCLGWRWQRACELLFEEGLHECMLEWGAWQVLLELSMALLPPAGVLVRRNEERVASLVAMLYSRMGEFQLSYAYFERVLAIQRQSGDVHGEANTLIQQGELLLMGGKRELAHRNFAQAHALNNQLQDQELACALLYNSGRLFYEERNHQDAFYHYLRAWRLAQDQQLQQQSGMILTNLGLLLYEQGLHKEGLCVLLEAFQLRQAQHDSTFSQLASFLNSLEQRMGTAAYTQICREAVSIRQEVFSRFITFDVRK
jgi:tetratricopeptide (TPR) repeat protein